MNLQEATELARTLHHGQVDKSGQPYELHPLAVRDMLAGEDEEVLIAAVLHDVVEDCGVTLDDLREKGCPERSVQIIDAVTRRPGETYMDFIARAARHPDGRKVKLADNMHNSMRLGNLPPKQAASMRVRYGRARAILWKA